MSSSIAEVKIKDGRISQNLQAYKNEIEYKIKCLTDCMEDIAVVTNFIRELHDSLELEDNAILTLTTEKVMENVHRIDRTVYSLTDLYNNENIDIEKIEKEGDKTNEN